MKSYLVLIEVPVAAETEVAAEHAAFNPNWMQYARVVHTKEILDKDS